MKSTQLRTQYSKDFRVSSLDSRADLGDCDTPCTCCFQRLPRQQPFSRIAHIDDATPLLFILHDSSEEAPEHGDKEIDEQTTTIGNDKSLQAPRFSVKE